MTKRQAWNKGKKMWTQEDKDRMSAQRLGRSGHWKGKKLSLETRNKLSISHKGQVPWNKGKSDIYSLFVRSKMSKSAIKKFQNGFIHPMQGRKHKPESLEKFKQKRPNWVIPKKDTKPERLLQEALTAENIIFETHKAILGQPDIFIEPNLCIFVDGDYWHNLPKSIQRDTFVNEQLEKQGYKILRFWEHEIYENMSNITITIITVIGDSE